MRAALLAAALLGAAPADASTVLTSGTLTDAAGLPAPGTVRVYAWPHSTRAMTLALVGAARAGAGGEFTVVADDTEQLLQLARQRDGWLDFTAVAETMTGSGEWTFTGFVARTPAGVRATARIASTAAEPRIAIRADRPRPLQAAASRSAEPHCRNERQVTKPKHTRALAVVGELNNAYDDGTRGRFTYGREHTADTEFGIAVSHDDGDTWFIGGENHVGDHGSATFPPAKRRYARKLRTLFEFSHQAARNNTCAVFDHYIRATSWIGGTNSDLRQPRALNRCEAAHLNGGFEGGSVFHRARHEAVRWTRGAAAFGVYLTTQSGFSENVRLDYTFGGPVRKNHYLCGPDGRSSPYEAGRIFSGPLR
jgi:hypothetical protein